MDILSSIGIFLAGVGYVIIGFFSGTPAPLPTFSLTPTTVAPVSSASQPASTPAAPAGVSTQNTASSTGPHVYSQSELLALAGDAYANGSVPLGDNKYVTTAAKKGYVYLCNVHKDNPGSMVNGPWITGTTWNFKNKVTVDGTVAWPNATFSNTLSGAYRVLTGNDLPISHTTGVFPVASSDDAHAYDPNPNTISAQTLTQTLPLNPTYSDTPYCMGGEVGIMLSGVALFNAFDAGLRDAPAHELQDSCSGHPQGSGEYHYHSLPSCLKDTSVSTVIGYAYDGFPITGPVVVPGKYLTTDNLDECHGLTSEIVRDGVRVTTYHYVMTYDFPYSASCFRGKPVITGPSGGGPQSGGGQSSSAVSGPASGPASSGGPPQEAITACSGKATGAACTIQTPQGTLTGTCKTPPNASLACVPS